MYFLLCDFGDGLEIIDSFEDKETAIKSSFDYELSFLKNVKIVDPTTLEEMRQDLEYKVSLLTDD
jgi:hypothetical protein